MEHYHLTLAEIANLTDRSIKSVYFHAREKDGSIRMPLPEVTQEAPPETEEGTLQSLAFLLSANLITPANYAQCVEDAKRKFNGGGP